VDGQTTAGSKHIAASVVAQAYQPIIRGYFTFAAIYYAAMVISYFWILSGHAFFDLTAAAATACIVSGLAAYHLRNPQSSGQLEIITTVVNGLVLTNVLVALHIEYSQAKLVYFIITTIVFAFASVSMRQAAVGIIASLSALFFMIVAFEPDQIMVYSFIGFAAALTTTGIAYNLRRAIGLAVTARHDAEQRLEAAEQLGEAMRQQSLADSLTGLPNRRAFFGALEQSREKASLWSGHWLMLLDLDGFKAVNDHYGHITGDALLKAVAVRLQDYCGPQTHVCRMGGDEFNIILSSDQNEIEIERWCEKLLACVAEVYLIEERLIQISGSIGCYRISAKEADISLIQKADYALLHAKRSGKNRVVVFREELAKDAAERFTIEQALRIANFSEEIELLFQPQHDLTKGQIVCAEALARWHSPTLGAISPSRFIETAEECGLISQITLTVLDKVLSVLRSLAQPIPVSINLSGHDLISDQIIDQIIQRVKASDIPPGLIEFEITETAMMPDTARASANLHRLAALGHPLSLDDFGTGYSNFSYLRSLPISKLKVDRSFMENLGDPMSEKILRSLVGMAQTLGVHCLLEGIENQLELNVAKRVGAQSVQGYLFGKPMRASLLELLLVNGAKTDPIERKSAPTGCGGVTAMETNLAYKALRKQA
jgi:diguanylate cyclase (GGDEF)-like protein